MDSNFFSRPNKEAETFDLIFKNNYQDVKSKYILQKIFNNIRKDKAIKIVRYNKNIQNKINININDFKEYSEIYSSIEMEIIPVNNKYGKFINIKNQGDLKYFHHSSNNIF